MTARSQCLFCGIAAGEVPAAKVYEDVATVAFLDVRPASEGHTLVIPKAHYADLMAIDEATVAAVAVTARRLARALKVAFGAAGIRVGQLNGAAAGQTVFHYHVHLVPVREGQRAGLHGRTSAGRAHLEAVAARIRAALAAQAG